MLKFKKTSERAKKQGKFSKLQKLMEQQRSS
jgi:hypothetical protein